MAASLAGYDPRTGAAHDDRIEATRAAELATVVERAAAAGGSWSTATRQHRAAALSAVADALDAHRSEVVALADAETALGATRLNGEVARTSGQLRMFADLVRDGRFLDVVISEADASLGRPDLRRMRHPVGPVAVYAASNFPFAFSVLGGDTASALAAGCAVIVKAHDGHPITSRAVAEVARAALETAGANPDALGVVYGFDAGLRLIDHPAVRAAGFTGSLQGGRALFDRANARREPIPFYGELGSVNPVVVLPAAATNRPAALAHGYASSLTLGSGQFCTNPGLLFVPDEPGLLEALGQAVAGTNGGPMLTERMQLAYREALDQRVAEGVETLADGARTGGAWAVTPRVSTVPLERFAAEHDTLGREVFGPAGLVVRYPDVATLIQTLSRADVLEGALTATVHADDADHDDAAGVAELLRPRVGRLVFNGWPTGVAVCWAMHHGGPWPATTAPAHTSVGARAIERWLVPVVYQDWPDALLPEELRRDNPDGVPRLVQPAGTQP